MKAYYFSTQERKLQYGDNRPIKVGATHTVEGNLELCKFGLHASKHPFDALQYAPGPILWQVELGGEIIEGDDKCVASSRTYLKEIDTTEPLREFARWCALQVIHLWECPDVVKQYLETGDESLRDAAWDAARGAARDAARDAAWGAAWADKRNKFLEMINTKFI